ncbi:hypothetical protein HYFRA_00003307 [Hymenoscyphus fraxineus]|uniref:Rhodopsin domain-containing protein n=1 Tax=Hymenoscyphus fraxineus TaxID=746836 RepID=A0A9N9KS41_9HELO|nr:hypothetical protein HYFRA_00003307 [Hymenoscyphus fraxineus]
MAAPGIPPLMPLDGGDQDRGPQLMAMFWTEAIIGLLLVTLRVHVRYSIRGLGVDDWLMILTVILFMVMTAFVTKLALIGGARHVFYLTPDQIMNATKWSWISQPWGIFLFAPGKASVAFLILRIMGPKTVWRKWLLYFLIVMIFLVNSMGCIITFIQCDPPRALWTPGIPSTCWNPLVQARYNYFLAAWNIMTDVVLALLPTTIFWNMNMNPKKKIALCFLLGLGLIAALFSGIKIRYIIDLSARADFTWGAYDIQAWTGAEAFIMIFCGNIPPLQPLWDRFITHKLDSNYGKTPINQYKMRGTSNNNSGPTFAGRSQYSAPSTKVEASKGSVWNDDDEERQNIKGINATTDIRVSESSREVQM